MLVTPPIAKRTAVEPVQIEPVRGRFDDRDVDAGVDHRREMTLDVERLRRRLAGFVLDGPRRRS